MNEIVCPHCQKAFKVDESGYAEILKQVHNKDFERQFSEKVKALEDSNRLATANAILIAKNDIEKERDHLRAELAKSQITQELAVANALAAVTRERDKFQGDLERAVLEKQRDENALQTLHSQELQVREEAIERLKDMKLKLSTKMVGETLEQHCETEFNKLRATAFTKAKFDKDNDARNGSKGDYIYQDYDDSGLEITSIMF